MENEAIDCSKYIKRKIFQQLRDRGEVLELTADSLSKIEELTLTDIESNNLKGIDLLPNLKRLFIKASNVSEGIFEPINYSLSDDDIATIEKCNNLEDLTIRMQPSITHIDLSHMPKLRKVNISENINLDSIYGLDNLQQLEILTCYGNESMTNIERLDKAIINNKDHLEQLKLDVLLFPSAIGYNPATGGYNQTALEAVADGNTSWAQRFAAQDCGQIIINNDQMIKMHNKACKILGENVPLGASTQDTIVAVERYLAENVTYDETAHSVYNWGANGSYNCLVENKCVCEGYTRGEQYLLSLRGIRTRNVPNVYVPDKYGLSDPKNANDPNFSPKLPKGWEHSIICYTDYFDLYSNTTENARLWQENGDKTLPCLFLSKSELKRRITLGFQDAKVQDAPLTDRSSAIEESLANNKLFRESVNNTDINQQRRVIRGAVPTNYNNFYRTVKEY